MDKMTGPNVSIIWRLNTYYTKHGGGGGGSGGSGLWKAAYILYKDKIPGCCLEVPHS